VNIRPFGESDQDQVVALWRECQLVVPWNDPVRDIQRKLAVDRDLFLVGLVADEVVGTVMGGYEGHRGWINYLAVHPSQRRRGFGEALMLAVEQRLRDRGCPKINLQIRTGNTAVSAFYRAIGYRDDEVICMGKRLESDER
jgi:ribosomal protein S18 acetylase RimI-like enzyme